jgi:hypothetical protein
MQHVELVLGLFFTAAEAFYALAKAFGRAVTKRPDQVTSPIASPVMHQAYNV